MTLNKVPDRMGQALMERWAEYQRFISTDADYSAIARLGEVENLLRHGKIAPPLRQRWRLTLDNEHVPEARLLRAEAGVNEDVARLRHVMSIGDEFIYEETMLLITLRVSVQLALEFFESRKREIRCEVQDVDESLRRIARSGLNFSAYESARRRARKNWGLPIVSKWLDS